MEVEAEVSPGNWVNIQATNPHLLGKGSPSGSGSLTLRSCLKQHTHTPLLLCLSSTSLYSSGLCLMSRKTPLQTPLAISSPLLWTLEEASQLQSRATQGTCHRSS